MTPNYLIFAWLEYLYFMQIIQLFVEANQINSNYSCFWTFVVQSQIIIQLWCHVRFINSNNINKNSINNLNMAKFIWCSSECFTIFTLIFALRSNTSTSNHHLCDSSTIRLRMQRFVIPLEDESWIGPPIRRSLVLT